MVNVVGLKMKMVEKGVNQGDVAKWLNICPKTMGFRLKNGIFNTKEIDVIQEHLELTKEEVCNIFLQKKCHSMILKGGKQTNKKIVTTSL